jgi:hypothetical protein
MGVFAMTPFYQQAWLFEPFFFPLRRTAVTSPRTVIPPSGMMSSWEVMAFFPSLAKNFSPRLVLTLIIRA